MMRNTIEEVRPAEGHAGRSVPADVRASEFGHRRCPAPGGPENSDRSRVNRKERGRKARSRCATTAAAAQQQQAAEAAAAQSAAAASQASAASAAAASQAAKAATVHPRSRHSNNWKSCNRFTNRD